MLVVPQAAAHPGHIAAVLSARATRVKQAHDLGLLTDVDNQVQACIFDTKYSVDLQALDPDSILW